MEPVTDPNFDAKAFVTAGYDRCAQTLVAAKSVEPPEWFPVFADRLPNQARVLDVGCGCGVPIASTLAARHRVTGIDISGEQIKLARSLVSNAAFIHGDVTEMTFERGSFDAAVMLYALFHIPREEQAEFLKKLRGWLVDGGLFLVSISERAEPGYTEDFFGTPMYWSNFSREENFEVFRDAGFAVIWETVIGHN